MARYYGRRWSGRNWGEYHVSQRQQLTNMFAGIDKDIQKIFFGLNANSLAACRTFPLIPDNPATPK
jgi:hypothetical protein